MQSRPGNNANRAVEEKDVLILPGFGKALWKAIRIIYHFYHAPKRIDEKRVCNAFGDFILRIY